MQPEEIQQLLQKKPEPSQPFPYGFFVQNIVAENINISYDDSFINEGWQAKLKGIFAEVQDVRLNLENPLAVELAAVRYGFAHAEVDQPPQHQDLSDILGDIIHEESPSLIVVNDMGCALLVEGHHRYTCR